MAKLDNDLPAKVDLNIIFTGLVTYTLTPIADRDSFRAVFVMPRATQWRNSQNDGNVRIPPHRAFLIAREEDVAFDNGTWKGAPPTGRLLEKWVYWLFDSDWIYIDNLRGSGVTRGNTSDVIHLPDLCSDARLSAKCIDGNAEEVAARVTFNSGRLTQRSLTTARYVIQPCSGDPIGPKEIADEVQIALKDVPRNDGGEIVIKRCQLDGVRDGRAPILLRPLNPLTKIFFGCAPEVDLAAVVSRAPNHRHDQSNYHFELHFDLSRRRPYAPVPVPSPVMDENGAFTRIGPIGGTDRCPPGSS